LTLEKAPDFPTTPRGADQSLVIHYDAAKLTVYNGYGRERPYGRPVDVDHVGSDVSVHGPPSLHPSLRDPVSRR